MPFPSRCIRGIPNQDFINDDGTIATHLFYFNLNNVRADGWRELSINWEDDDNTISFTLEQLREDGELQFRAGIVLAVRETLDLQIATLPNIDDALSYERQPLETNPYHGNLLLRGTVIKARMRQIAAMLAIVFADFIERPAE